MEVGKQLAGWGYSKPFFLGSEEHKSVISYLDAPVFKEPLDLGSVLAGQQGNVEEPAETRHQPVRRP